MRFSQYTLNSYDICCRFCDFRFTYIDKLHPGICSNVKITDRKETMKR